MDHPIQRTDIHSALLILLLLFSDGRHIFMIGLGVGVEQREGEGGGGGGKSFHVPWTQQYRSRMDVSREQLITYYGVFRDNNFSPTHLLLSPSARILLRHHRRANLLPINNKQYV